MRSDYFDLFHQGIAGEMNLTDMAGKLEILAVYRDVSLFDGTLASSFVSGFMNDKDLENSPDGQEAFIYCLERARQALPLQKEIFDLLESLSPNPERARQREILQRFAFSEKGTQAIEASLAGERPETLNSMLHTALRENAANVAAATALLRLDAACRNNPREWLNAFTCPKPLAALWQNELFLHYAKRGLWKEALPLWETLPPAQKNPYAAVFAADMHVLAGNAGIGLALYKEALAADPLLTPVRYKIKAMENPQALRPKLLHERTTALCLYSWNKGPVLEKTLRALAATDTGNNSIFVLLNGCTDDSRERVLAVKPLFGDRPFEIIDLPVNVGAPAARNWLINLPKVQASDYVAFMDDDVIMPKDWLVRYLTEAESDPAIGVVGCKVVFPQAGDEAPAVQYCYRNVTTALPGALKLSLPELNPGMQDTGLYAFSRNCMSVMGCLHLLRVSTLKDVGGFDLRFSPSQVDDLDHDLCTCLKGYTIRYCGMVTCEHHQNSGVGTAYTARHSLSALGSIIGNDLKLNYKHAESLRQLQGIARSIRTF